MAAQTQHGRQADAEEGHGGFGTDPGCYRDHLVWGDVKNGQGYLDSRCDLQVMSVFKPSESDSTVIKRPSETMMTLKIP